MGLQCNPSTASALLLLSSCVLGATGCNNTCVSGTLNGPGGSTVSVKTGDPPPSCSLSTASGMVHLEIGAASGTTSSPFVIAPLRPRVTHLFVTISGVDAHSSPLAVDDTPGWQPLAAALPQHPVQLDLLGDPDENAASVPFTDASLPAGAYRQNSPAPCQRALRRTSSRSRPLQYGHSALRGFFRRTGLGSGLPCFATELANRPGRRAGA
ncbi:MAG TPA: hypothetical protein VKQ28_01225 [Candidatus Acidoferrum sp.]|nr:hypothetical protein [Candidatus Acidoferrum sp.]